MSGDVRPGRDFSADQLQAVAEQDPTSWEDILRREDTPQEVREWISQRAPELARELRPAPVVSQAPTASVEPAPVPAVSGGKPASGAPRRRGWVRWLVVGVALVAAFVVVGVGVWWMMREPAAAVQSGEGESGDAQSGEAQPAGGVVGELPALRAGGWSFACQTGAAARGVSCWGRIGEDTQPPTAVSGVEGKRFTALAVGYGFGVGVDTENRVWAWGKNDHGQLGMGVGDTQWAAHEVGTAPGDVSQVVAGVEHTCVLSGGEAWCFGSNRVGQVRGVKTDEGLGLTHVDGPSGVTALGSSGYDTWAETPEGLWVWGSNKWGALVPTDAAETLPPTLVAAPENASQQMSGVN